MKRYTLILLFGLLGFLGYGQGVSFLTSGNTSMAFSKTYKEFASSYNEHFIDDLDNNLSNRFQFNTGYTFGVGYGIYGHFFGLCYESIQSKNQASYSTGGKRIFESINNGLQLKGLFASSDDKGISLLGSVGIKMSRQIIVAKYEYADGTVSMGKDKSLNGEYSWLQANFSIGAGVKYKIADMLSIYGEANFSVRPVLVPISLTDYHDGKASSLANTPTGIPTDYTDFLDKQSTFDYDVDKYVKNDFHHFTINIGLIWTVGL